MPLYYHLSQGRIRPTHFRPPAWFKRSSQLRVAGVDAQRATPPDPRPARWGLAGCRQLDPSHPALVTPEYPGFEPCRPPALAVFASAIQFGT